MFGCFDDAHAVEVHHAHGEEHEYACADILEAVRQVEDNPGEDARSEVECAALESFRNAYGSVLCLHVDVRCGFGEVWSIAPSSRPSARQSAEYPL